MSLYALALRCAADLPADRRVRLLEAYAAYAQESQLLGPQTEAIAAQRQELKLWGDLGNPLKQGETLAGLMAMLIRAGQTAEAERGSQTAIAMLEGLPPGRELAFAYRVRASLNLEGFKYFVGTASAVYFGAYGRKETPIGSGKLNRLDVEGWIPAPKLAEVKLTVTPLTVEFADAKGINLFAAIKVPGLASGKVGLTVQDFSAG